MSAVCRYVEEAGVDDEAEVTGNEIDDQVRSKNQLVVSWSIRNIHCLHCGKPLSASSTLTLHFD